MADVVRIPPAAEPMAVGWIKQHTRIAAVTTAHDELLAEQFLPAAREKVEGDTNRLFVQQTRVLYLDRFPRVICIRNAPVRALVSVKYLDQDGTEQTLALDQLNIDPAGEWFTARLADDATWPITDDAPNAVRVTYRAGYAAPFSADESTNVLTAVDHDLSDGDCVRPFTLGGTLPAGLSSRNYYVVNATSDTLQLALTEGGSAVEFTTAGSGDLFIASAAGHSVYRRMILAMAFAASTWFENREAVTVGMAAAPLPFTYDEVIGGLSRVTF